jgi:outer membrane immunogenic protein
MKKLLAAGVVLIGAGLAGAANAADLEVAPYKAPPPVVPVFTWGGFYLGGNVGGHWGSDQILTATDSGAVFGGALDLVSSTNLHPEGFVGGGQVGYNWAGIGGVWGVEIDADWLGGTASRALPVAGVGTLSDSTQASFLSTFRMRWGIPFDRVLLYGTAGFAIGTLKTTDTLAQPGLPVQTVSASSTKAGLAIGAGLDWAITDNWWIRGEYLYVQFQNTQPVIPSTGLSDDVTVTHKYSDNIARFALNYRISGSGM